MTEMNDTIPIIVPICDLNKLTKSQLKVKCEELGLKKYKSKNMKDLINLINQHNHHQQPTTTTNSVVLPQQIVEDTPKNIEIQNICGLAYLKTIENNSINLILTDPPYIISKESGMNSHYNKVKHNEENNTILVKTEEEWEEYKKQNEIDNDTNKEKYMKYGSIFGKKYCVQTQYGDWDDDFTMEILDNFVCEYYKKLKKGGTLIMFFDIWKITLLKNILEKEHQTKYR